MFIRHAFRSKEFTTLLNRFGHCENYSFAVELETAIANELDASVNILSEKIIPNPNGPSLFHSDFDNFDQYINTLSGAGSIHTAHGIMLQEISDMTLQSQTENLPSQVQQIKKRTKERSISFKINTELPDCYVTNRDSPNIVVDKGIDECDKLSFDDSKKCFTIYYMLREINSSNQLIPGLSGFLTCIGKKPKNLTRIDYYPVIQKPITDYNTVQEVLRYSQEASEKVGQSIVITTFDLGVCMKAYPLVWNNPVKYKNHIIMIGTFHLISAYFKMIGKKMAGSGFSDILLESGLITNGSIVGVTTGKNYARALNCHKALSESLMRQLMKKYNEFHDDQEYRKELENAFHDFDENKLNDLLTKDSVIRYISGFEGYLNSITNNKTIKFWLNYLNHVNICICLLKAVKHNDFHLYRYCLNEMCSLFFAYDGHNYARYLTYFSSYMNNIDQNHPGGEQLLKMGAFSVARSFIPGNRCAVDKTIEETFMKHAKSKGGAAGSGIIGIANNPEAYQRWASTLHKRTLFVGSMLQLADMEAPEHKVKHKDLRTTEIRRSEVLVQSVTDALDGLLNPLKIDDTNHLYCVSSGKFVDQNIEKDLLDAEKIGKDAQNEFINSRLAKKKDFFLPIKKSKLKTFKDIAKTCKLKTSTSKEIEYKQQSNVAFQLLIQAQNHDQKLDLIELMSYPLTPVPYSLGTADGGLLKTNKAKGMEHLLKGN